MSHAFNTSRSLVCEKFSRVLYLGVVFTGAFFTSSLLWELFMIKIHFTVSKQCLVVKFASQMLSCMRFDEVFAS